MPITLYDAPRCPFCARTRIVLAEKGVPYDTVTVDLADRPPWLLERNPPDGRVPILEEHGWLLPESVVIDEYLEERYPKPPLLPDDPGERAAARLLVFRFDETLGDPTTPSDASSRAPTGGWPSGSVGSRRCCRPRRSSRARGSASPTSRTCRGSCASAR